MKGFFCFVVLLVMAQAGYGQSGKGYIKGKVVDATTGLPVEYAAIVVMDMQTKKLVTGGTTDSSGRFKIDDIADGNYYITIEFVGYRRDTLNGIALDASGRDISLKTVLLQPVHHSLKSVTVTASAPIVENKIDKIVYNAANDLTAQGGTAIDLLKKVPQVGVDIDGNVEVQGNSNIRFLINGKPSSIFNSPADALASIPASQIKSIEVITSPGAKYDAEGTGGIINIILKDNKLQGINGNVNLSAGTRLENTSVNLNYRNGNFGMNAFFSGNAQLTSRTPNSQNRVSYDSLHFIQNGYYDLERQGFQSGIGFDWNVTKHDNFTGGIGYNYLASSNTNFYNQQQFTQYPAQTPITDVPTFRNSDSKFRNNSIELSLAYKKTFKEEGRELSVLCSSSLGNPVSDYALSQNYVGDVNPYNGSSSHSPGTDRESNVSIDYTQPVKKNTVLETGLKTTLQNIYSSANVNLLDAPSGLYYFDNTQSYTLNYDRKIYAVYILGSFSIGKLKVKGGVRFEHTDTKIDFPNTSIPSYNSYAPSLVIMRELKNGSSIKISYSHRIERPDFRMINPFVNRSDPYNITTGNPLLQPEIADNFELGYNKTIGKSGNIYVGLFERYDYQDLKPVTNFYISYKVGDSVYSNVSVTNQQNIGKEYNTGMTIFGSISLFDKLSLRGNLLAAQRYVVSTLAHNGISIGYRMRANMTASYQLPANLVVEAFGNYNAASQLLQGKMPQSLTYTFACRKQFRDKKASVGLTATNIFSKYISQVTTINTESYVSYTVRELPYRSVGISFSYKFGKLEFKKNKEDDTYFNKPPDNGQ